MTEKILTNLRIIDPSQKMDEVGNIIIDNNAAMHTQVVVINWEKISPKYFAGYPKIAPNSGRNKTKYSI